MKAYHESDACTKLYSNVTLTTFHNGGGKVKDTLVFFVRRVDTLLVRAKTGTDLHEVIERRTDGKWNTYSFFDFGALLRETQLTE